MEFDSNFNITSRENNIANLKTRIDIFSNIFLVTTIGSLVIYLVEGNQYGYSNSNLLLFLLLFILFAVGLVVHDKKSKAPIVPHQLLKNAKFIVSNLLGLVVNISLYGIVLVLGLYFQTYLNLSSMVSGLLILPGMIVLIIGNLFTHCCKTIFRGKPRYCLNYFCHCRSSRNFWNWSSFS